jgi:hypothetical protein
MPLFGRQKSQPTLPAARTIPPLNPAIFHSIHVKLIAAGGADSEADIAAGVATAIFNVGNQYLDRVGDGRAARTFQGRFASRSRDDRSAADNMIDWFIAYSPGTQEWLTTLVGRLTDVLSRPA